jgi:hypothetical protein
MRSISSSDALIGGGGGDRQTLECMRFINLLERLLLAIQLDVTPECFNLLLKSQATLVYRLALEAGGEAAAEIARITSGPPNRRRRHGGGAHQHR